MDRTDPQHLDAAQEQDANSDRAAGPEKIGSEGEEKDGQANGGNGPAAGEKEGPAPEKNEKAENLMLHKKVGEYEDDLRRLAAEFDNYKKRAEKEKRAARLQGKAEALAPFLDMEDAFEQALAHADKETGANAADQQEADRPIREGLGLLHRKLQAIFAADGVKEIRCDGLPDHARHEVMLQTDGHPAGHIAQVFRKGYEMDGYVLRHAQVAVFSERKKEAQKPESEKERKEKNNGNEEGRA